MENDVYGETVPVIPRRLSPADLLATYEKLSAEGVPGAQVRLSMLRRKLTHPMADTG